jgi:putative acetyltransferase
MNVEITIEDPTTPAVIAVLERHLAFARLVTPEGGVFALDLEALCQPDVTFLCARADGRLLGVAALKALDEHSVELKSMHTIAEARGNGVGRTLVAHALELARDRGYGRVNLETGNFEAFAPARALYQGCGFTPCEPYGQYQESPTSACMTIALDPLSP